MRRTTMLAITLVLALHAFPSAAQVGIPTSVAEAAADGAAYPRGAAPEHAAADFRRASGGTTERRCVAQYPAGSTADNQLRSGEFIVRGPLVKDKSLVANRPNKIVWMPLHDPVAHPAALLLRASRIGHPGEGFRQAVDYLGYPGRGHEHEFFFVSGTTFPQPGTWVVIATAGDDWGCFLLKVGPG